jgi:hypothetical protein
VCFNKPKNNRLTNVEDGWRKLDSDYSVRIVETKENLIDGSILFPYKGMVAYVKSESSLYILLTTGADNAKDINNWNKITSNSSSNSIDKVGIDTDPEGGSGFKITENKDVIIEDYINSYNYIKANYYYTSQGLNSYDQDPNFTYSFVKLTKGGDSFIKLYSNSTKWMEIYDSNNVFGFTIKHKGEAPYVDPDDGTITIYKGTSISFGVDIKFTEGWEISYDDIESRSFVESDYELIDIYRSSYAPEVYAYYNGLDVKVLTGQRGADGSRMMQVIPPMNEKNANQTVSFFDNCANPEKTNGSISQKNPIKERPKVSAFVIYVVKIRAIIVYVGNISLFLFM